MSDDISYSDEEDDHGILKKALDVELPENFDPAKIPETGEEYLQHVIYERMHCKTWLTADIDRTKFKDKQTLKINVTTKESKTPKSLLPTVEWQQEKLEEFSNLRKFTQFKRNTEPNVSAFDEEQLAERILKETPQLSEMLTYSQAAKIRMLQIIAKHLDTIQAGSCYSSETGAWIFSILTLVEKPLNPNFCHTLREFTKRLIGIRSNLPENCSKSDINSLNLFICVVGRFFHQLDLADA